MPIHPFVWEQEMGFFWRSHVLLVFLKFFLLNRLRVFNTSLTLSDSSTKLLYIKISHYESYPIFLVCIKRWPIASYNLLSRYIEDKRKVITSAFCKGIFGKTVDSFLKQGLFFFSSKENIKQNKKNSQLLVSKSITPSSCRAFDWKRE